MGKRLVDRHALLEDFMRLIGVSEDVIFDDVEGIEHHLSWDSITCIEYLVQYLQENPARVEELRQLREAEDEIVE